MRRALVACALALVLAPVARAQPTLTADLSAHQIALSPGSPGAVTLFGTASAPGDIVVVMRGPEADAVVRRGPFDNFWLTAHSVAFGGVPGFYAVYASAPLDAIVSAEVQALHQIGLANLRFALQSTGEDPAVARQYRADLIAAREHAGLYIDAIGKVAVGGGGLFRATLALPADAPAGSYFVEVLLLRGKALVAGQTMSLAVSAVSANGTFGAADWRLLLYGGLAVLAVVVAGSLALRLRRRRAAAAMRQRQPQPEDRTQPAKERRRR